MQDQEIYQNYNQVLTLFTYQLAITSNNNEKILQIKLIIVMQDQETCPNCNQVLTLLTYKFAIDYVT